MSFSIPSAPATRLLPSCLLVVTLLGAAPQPSTAYEQARQVGMLRLAVQEYSEGVVDGRVIDQAELATAVEILELLAADAPSAELGRVRRLVGERAAVEEVAAAFAAWLEVHGVGVEVPRPTVAPSPIAGARLFERYCASCHGASGNGEGPLAELIEGAKPADFTDAEFMAVETPDEFFQVISYGLPATAMPEWGTVLTEQERWDLVAHLWRLRSEEPSAQTLAECRTCHGSTGAAGDLTIPGALFARSDGELAERLHGSAVHAHPDARRAVSLVVAARRLDVSQDEPAAEDGLAARAAAVEAATRYVGNALELTVEEYRDAVAGGQVVNAVEYGEARIFQARVASDIALLTEAHRLSDGDQARALARALGDAILIRADVDRVERLAYELGDLLRGDLGGAERDHAILETLAAVTALVTEAAGAPPAVAGERLLEAYMIFERVEKRLAARDPTLATDLEKSFARARSDAMAGAASPATFAALAAGLASAADVLSARRDQRADFVTSLLIILREGLEAILIIGALAAYLLKGGHLGARRWLYAGAVVGILVSIVTAFLIEALLGGLGLGGEVLEGLTMLLAAAALFSVSYWLISKVEARHWQEYIRDRLDRALGAGSRIALAGVSFLAVYREGFETILFYRALLVDADSSSAVAAGFVVGCVALVVLYVGIARFSMRIPIKPFFSLTGILLYVLAFRFLGGGIGELQEAGVIPLTPVWWWPEVRVLDMSPNLETGIAQMTLIAAALVAAVVIRMRPRLAARAG